MKSKLYATAALAGLMLAGCNNQDEPGSDPASLAGIPIRVTTEVMRHETRTEMTDQDLTEFYFRTTDEGGTTTNYDYFTKMILADDGTWTAETEEIDWNTSKAKVSAVAQKTADGSWLAWTKTDHDSGKEVSVLAGQSSANTSTDGYPTDENVKASDLLYMPAAVIDPNDVSNNPNIENGKVKVSMKHAFAKLDIIVNIGTTTGGNETSNPITALTVDGTRLKGTFRPADSNSPLTVTADAGNPAASITARNYAYTKTGQPSSLIAKAQAQYECIVLPQTVAEKGFKVTATIGDETYTYTHAAAITFAENKKYSLTLNVGENSLSMGSVSVSGFDDETVETGDGKMKGPVLITPSNTNQTLQGGNGEKYIIEGNGTTQTTGRIVINGSAEVTLKNVNIKVADGNVASDCGEAIEVTSGTVTFNLKGENKLEGYGGSALYCKEKSTIVLQGSGKLTAQGGYPSAAIGGSRYNSGNSERHAGIIKILGGTIDAKGHNGCPGIGAGYGSCRGVEILGGTVKATQGGGYSGPAIGNSNPPQGNRPANCAYVTLANCTLYLYSGGIGANTVTPNISAADTDPTSVRSALDTAGVTIYSNGTEETNRWPAVN